MQSYKKSTTLNYFFTYFQASHAYLLNQKCRAPFHIKGQIAPTYHNGFIADIQAESRADGDVMLKVLFLNPIVEKMKPCEHFLNLSCNFDENCKFSHGELVKFSKIQSYQEPNYSLLKKKCHVLIKTESSIWKPGTILEISEDLRTCQVKLQNSGKIFDCPFSDILPPIDTDSDSSDLSSEDECEEEFYTSRNVFQIDDNFGEWEKFTTGFGSKMLQKLGYVEGQGLGKSK